jgi:hypothetical protein
MEVTYSAGDGQGEIDVEKTDCVCNWALAQGRVGCDCLGHSVNVRRLAKRVWGFLL